MASGDQYDGAGNVTNDGANAYLYDGEGRVCATQRTFVPGDVVMTGYLYDAEGNRVAKGTIQSFSCDLTQNGFATTTQYIVGQSGEQITAVDGQGNWKRSNVYAAGAPLATYDANGLHFNLADALGTKRVQVNATGTVDETCQSLPIGDALSCTGPGAIFRVAQRGQILDAPIMRQI
ncbi:MAG TPA: hypothetical protein VMU62_05850, partial [Acidobacteriaceae bacterium]|nr:hypothetical protein [Acidobacteriaceae bacterium]